MKDLFFTKNFKLFLFIPLIIMAIALVMTFTGNGLNMGIDFTGGSMLRYDMGGVFETSDVEDALKAQGITEWQIAHAGDGDVKTIMQVRLKDMANTDEVRAGMDAALREKHPNMQFLSIDRVGAVAGRDLLSNAIYSIIIVAVCLLIYIGIRFDFYSGLAALTGLTHDVLVMMSLMVLCRAFFQINSSFIAAILTIVGYSINNTIVIFDRIRENAKKPKFRQEYAQHHHYAVVDTSVRETLNRTINTTLTTLFTIVALFILGVASIREFAFPLIVGIIAGTYSSVLISGQVWAYWLDHDTFKRILGKITPKRA